MTFSDFFSFFKLKLWENIRVRSVLLSILIHLSFILVYFILTYQSTVSTYDFGFDSNYNGLPPVAAKKGKKMKLMERSKEEIVPKEKSVNGTEPSEEKKETSEQSGDEADIADAVDMAFAPGAKTPSMLGGLKQYYPPEARKLNIEATVHSSVIINRNGKVIKVKIVRVVLSKKLPPEQERSLKEQFGMSLTRSFKEVLFTRPMIDGKNIPIEMEQTVHYTLKE